MVFSSLIFLSVFLPITLLLYFVSPKKARNLVLLIVSLLFYAWGEPVYIVLMLVSIILNYIFGRAIGAGIEKKSENASSGETVKGSKALLILSIVVNVGLLVVFKYANLLINTVDDVFGLAIDTLELSLPIGISFYTFQAMSYVIDVYRGNVKYNKNIIDFGAYISMFPQLIAGPIVRYKTVAEELKSRTESVDEFSVGLNRFVIGLGKKVLLANTCGSVWDNIRVLSSNDLSTATAWLGLVFFTLQIYFDFSGYSDMAIGLGRMFGFHFLENFDYPYESASITEFWRRWHISLSSWFKEYVYIPLGGNRKGLFRQLVNIFIVWMLTGIWHGANWNFLMWGLYYAVLLIIEKVFLLKVLDKLPKFICHIYALILVVFGWGIFSWQDISHKGAYLKALFFNADLGIVSHNTLYYLMSGLGFLILAVIGSTSLPKKIAGKLFNEDKKSTEIVRIIYMVIIVALSVAFIVSDTYNPFLYFRF